MDPDGERDNVSGAETPDGVSERLIEATVRLLAEQGPSAIKARSVAAASGLSTMVVYSRFGGIAELTHAVIDHGFRELGRAFSRVLVTDDPIADLCALALTCRQVARANPHLYDLMFGLSTRATYRPQPDSNAARDVRSDAFRSVRVHLADACQRLVGSGRIGHHQPDVVAAQLWSYVHGFITLELSEHFAEFRDPVVEVMLPMGVSFSVGLGDTPERAHVSHMAAARGHDSMTDRPSA